MWSGENESPGECDGFVVNNFFFSFAYNFLFLL
jgi:hypothetical protein